MKKKLLLAAATCMLFGSVSFANNMVYEKPEINIIVNGKGIEVTDVPIIVNSRTLIPLRNLLVALGVPDNNENIQWIPETRQVNVYHNGTAIQLNIDSDVAYVNNEMKKLDTAATIHNSRTYLPARFVGEALGYQVFWNSYTPAVVVTENTKHNNNTAVFSSMKKALENISDYQAEFASRTLISIENSDLEEEHMKYVYEKTDFKDRIMEVLTLHKESQIEEILEYYSDSAKYYNKAYQGEFVDKSWQVTAHDMNFSDKTPFEAKEKLLDFAFDESLYGMLNCTDIGKYCVYNITKNEDILKSLAKSGLYFEMVDGEGQLKDMQIMMFVSKETFLPESIQIETVREIKNSEKYGKDNVVTESSSFYLKVQSYNKNIDIDLP